MVCTFRFCVKIVPPILDVVSMCLYLCAVYWEIVPLDILKCYSPKTVYFPGKCLALKVQFWQWFPKSDSFPCKRFMQADNLFDTGCQGAMKCLVTPELCWDGCCELEVKAPLQSSLCLPGDRRKAHTAPEWARRYFSLINISQKRWRWHHPFCKNTSYPVRTYLILTLPKNFTSSPCWGSGGEWAWGVSKEPADRWKQ